MGWSVHCLCRSRPDIAHPAMTFTPVDLLDATAFEAALRDIGLVHALVHSAGVLKVGRHDAMSLDDGETMWRLHVDCAARMVKHLAPRMPDGGRIVLIGSRVAAGASGRSLYAASKAALIGFARSVAAELAPRRITVNFISPGTTDTPMLTDPSRAGEPPQDPAVRAVRVTPGQCPGWWCRRPRAEPPA